MSFADLKKNRAAAIGNLTAAATKIAEGGKSYEDDRFWAPTVDKAGNGFAVIRFLPAGKGEELPWVRYWDHGFKGPTGRWYIENSLTTIGKDDPVSELNSKLWNSGVENDKEIARLQKRRLHYVVNILVVSDPANPKNDGTVRLYKFGKKIFDKIADLMSPAFPDEKPVNPFDFWEGADFRIKIRNVEGYRNYDKSEFAKPEPLFGGDDDKLKETYEKLFPLQDFVNPKNYKSYAELKKKLVEVLGEGALTGEARAEVAARPSAAPAAGKTAETAEIRYASAPGANDETPPESEKDEAISGPAASPTADSKNDTLSYFAKLAAQE